MSNAEIVQDLYAAFGRGDIPAILDRLADDVEWDTWTEEDPRLSSVPWLAPRRGRDEVVGFFEVIGQWEVHRFDVLGVMDGGDKVAAEIEFDMGLPGDVTLAGREIHLWEFDGDGKIAGHRHYLDNAATHVKAAEDAGLLVS